MIRSYWIAFALVIALSFATLGYFGHEIYVKAPPIPEQVVAADGTVIYTREQIQRGQNVWQSIGGMEVGSIWGHGAYVAPDWTADWLHREAEWLLAQWAQELGGTEFSGLHIEQQAQLKARLAEVLRTNSYDEESGTITVSVERARALAAVAAHYDALFSDNPELNDLRNAYALQRNAVPDAENRAAMGSFFFWTAWASSTNRPGSTITYTHNWPPEELIGNRPTPALILWTGFSVILLIVGIGAMAWFQIVAHAREEPVEYPETDLLRGLVLTPAMRATYKFFWVATALLVVQIVMGVVAAHYGVEGNGFYGLPISDWLPYAVVRTWHTQLGIFWIATAWLATGLFLAPVLAGKDPPFQVPLVNFLFIALVGIVVGSMAGQWFSVMQRMNLTTSFWFGHQGYEYVDLGRFWQLFLFVGLVLWLFLMLRTLLPALKKAPDTRSLVGMFIISIIAIGGFYAAGLMWNQHTNLAIVEYWRWWVVHLWVEGFFEVFATSVIALIFVRLGLLRVITATAAVIMTAVIYLSGGIIGTFHHLYFTGTPTAVLALGATFSALEVVPLILVGFEAHENWRLSHARPWLVEYRWPLMYLLAVAFWNLLGAGVFGFLINTPIALYFMQGLNTTPLHGHTALFGVYGNLGIGLTLFCLKAFSPGIKWQTKPLAFSFWAINIGLLGMALLSLLPVGLLQTYASVEHGMWFARSAEFMQQPIVSMFRWMRVPGDSLFALGALALAWFVFTLPMRRYKTVPETVA